MYHTKPGWVITANGDPATPWFHREQNGYYNGKINNLFESALKYVPLSVWSALEKMKSNIPEVEKKWLGSKFRSKQVAKDWKSMCEENKSGKEAKRVAMCCPPEGTEEDQFRTRLTAIMKDHKYPTTCSDMYNDSNDSGKLFYLPRHMEDNKFTKVSNINFFHQSQIDSALKTQFQQIDDSDISDGPTMESIFNKDQIRGINTSHIKDVRKYRKTNGLDDDDHTRPEQRPKFSTYFRPVSIMDALHTILLSIDSKQLSYLATNIDDDEEQDGGEEEKNFPNYNLGKFKPLGKLTGEDLDLEGYKSDDSFKPLGEYNTSIFDDPDSLPLLSLLPSGEPLGEYNIFDDPDSLPLFSSPDSLPLFSSPESSDEEEARLAEEALFKTDQPIDLDDFEFDVEPR
jgi:hypothetical protein